jgi:SAM-dependent methyltransferase
MAAGLLLGRVVLPIAARLRVNGAHAGGVAPESESIHQHPLAYLIGVEGVALLRCFAGEHDAATTAARLGEVAHLLAIAQELGPGASTALVDTPRGYAAWAPSYDEPGNQLLDIEGPVVRCILDGLPAGVAVDAACGTGRHSLHLAARGHRVIGVDSSPEMLAVARAKLPEGDWRTGDLHDLPVPDADADLVVCALALTHVPDLAPIFTEFARVLRPGGHLVVSDARSLVEGVGCPVLVRDARGHAALMRSWDHRTSAYLAAALPLGFAVRACLEPTRPDPLVGDDVSTVTDPPDAAGDDPAGPPNIWALHGYAPGAVNDAYAERPAAIVWHFQLGQDPGGR